MFVVCQYYTKFCVNFVNSVLYLRCARVHLDTFIIFTWRGDFLRKDVLYPHNPVQKCHCGGGGGEDKDIKVSHIFGDEISTVVRSHHSQNNARLRQGVASDPRLRLEVGEIAHVAVDCHVEIKIGACNTKHQDWQVVETDVDVDNVVGVDIVQASVQCIGQT